MVFRRHRVEAIETAVLSQDSWRAFTIWGAGRDGREFFKALTPETICGSMPSAAIITHDKIDWVDPAADPYEQGYAFDAQLEVPRQDGCAIVCSCRLCSAAASRHDRRQPLAIAAATPEGAHARVEAKEQEELEAE